MEFSQEKFETFLIDQQVIGYKQGGITLRSGRVSHWYANFRDLSARFSTLELLTQYIAAFILDTISLKEIDAIIGIPEGARILGYETHRYFVKKKLLPDNIPALREREKDYGESKNRLFTNGYMPSRVILIEDVVTTGESIIGIVSLLNKFDIVVSNIIGLLDRLELDDQGYLAREKFKRMDIAYSCLADATLLRRLTWHTRPEIQAELTQQYHRRADSPLPDILGTLRG